MKRFLAIPLILAALGYSNLGCNDKRPAVPEESSAPPAAPSTEEARGTPQSLPTTPLKLGSKTFTVEIADEENERAIGLMHRYDLAPDRAMIFCFPDAQPRGFWMKNVYFPIDIVYLDADCRIISIRRMNALNENSVPSGGPAKFAIEMAVDVPQRVGLSVGQVLDIPAALRDAGR